MGDAIPSAAPPPGAAIGSADTRHALRSYALRSAGIVGLGILLAAAVGGVAPAAGAAGLLVSVAGVICLGNAVRVWWVLRRHPWHEWECRFRVVPGFGNGTPTLVLSRSADRKEFVLSVVSFKWRWRALNDCDGGTIWIAGNPARRGVVAPPGGTHLVWVRRPVNLKRRESLRRATLGPPHLEGATQATAAKPQLDQPG